MGLNRVKNFSNLEINFQSRLSPSHKGIKHVYVPTERGRDRSLGHRYQTLRVLEGHTAGD